MTLKYRREIDGLRAIAVLAVVIYHAHLEIAGVPLFTGGFIGVDIFFVISGFLITSIILREYGDTGFSYLRFYERRARRILPALFAVLIVSAAVGWVVMMPQALKSFAASGLSSLFFSSNVFFWTEDSYTAQASALKPLLHTWTLSLEEQFYIFFPILLGIVHRFAPRYIMGIMVLGLLVSLQAAQTTSGIWPDAAFYLLPARGWELLAGAVLAKAELDHGRSPGPLSSTIFPPVGLAFLLYAIVYFSDDMRHPSYMTAIPVVGTMLIIWFARPREFITDLLSSRLMLGTGLISYSLYLWHFPVFAFFRIRFGDPSQLVSLGLIAVSIVLGILSYFLVEKVTRRPTIIGRKAFLAGIFLTFAGLTGVYGYFYRSNGAPERLGAAANLFDGLRVSNIATLEGMNCHRKSPSGYCEAILPSATGNLVIVGDSHAGAVAPAFAELARTNNLNLYVLTNAGCPYVVGAYSVIDGKETKPGCDVQKNLARQAFLKRLPPSTVIYVNNLPYYLHRDFFDNREGGHVVLNRTITSEVSDLPRFKGKTWARLVQDTVNDLIASKHRVVVIYPIPEAGWNVPELVASKLDRVGTSNKQAAFEQLDLSTSFHVFRQRRASSKKILDQLGKNPNLLRIFPEKVFCSSETQRCMTLTKQHILYFDHNHLSVYGARMLANETARALDLKEIADD